MTRSDYLNLFDCPAEAIDFEHEALSIGSEFLPDFAQLVRDDEVDEPGPEYWDWLAGQLESARAS